MPLKSSSRKLLLLALAGLWMAGVLSCHTWPVLDPPFVLGQLTLYFGLFGVYLVGAWLGHNLQNGPLLKGLLAIGLLGSLSLLPLAPSMSDDLYRYIWDGYLQTLGLNPYLYPPSSAQLVPWYEPTFHPFINHADYRTIYPPTAQLLFWLSALLTPGSFLGYKLLLWLAHLVTLWLLAQWLRWRGQPQGRLLWLAWCPLPLFEVMIDGHLDGFAPMFLLLVLFATHHRRPWVAGIALGVGLLLKPLPLFILPLLLWHLRWRRALQAILAMSLTCLILYLPYIDAGADLFSSLLAYSRHWSFNGPLYSFLNIWLYPWACRLILGLALVGFSCLLPFLRLGLTREQHWMLPLLAYTWMTPTLYPWYLLWLAPWLVLAPSPALLWLFATISSAHFVQYTYLQTGRWNLPPEILGIEFVPFALLAITQLYLAWYRRRRRTLTNAGS